MPKERENGRRGPGSLSLPFVEGLYQQWIRAPREVPEDWQRWFESLAHQEGARSGGDGVQAPPIPAFARRRGATSHARTGRPQDGEEMRGSAGHAPAALPPRVPRPALVPHLPPLARDLGARDVDARDVGATDPGATEHGAGGADLEALRTASLQHRVDQLVRNYRVRGHIAALVDPLGAPRPSPPELDPSAYDLGEADLDRPFSTENVPGGRVQTLRRILQRMRNTYCRSIGAQFMHIDEMHVRRWLQERMEGTENRLALSREEQVRILTRLTDAVIFEEFVQKRFLGAKTFSLEGAESLIPLLDIAIEHAATQGIREIVLGMSHRGRLNVLANVMGKPAWRIFREFEDKDAERWTGRGDVKYHLGYSSDRKTASGAPVHLSLCFNPSHLEFVNAVALGRMRAKQDRFGPGGRDRGLVLLVHGDAAFAAGGVVQETLVLSELAAYEVGGTVHVIVNNQIGFTTDPAQARSSPYASDVARMLQVPIFHVNGEDPEAVAQVVRVALDFRQAFHRDVVIDMWCYRRLGHNEGDEPAFTQPVLYRRIRQRKPVREGYLEHLLSLGGIERAEADAIEERRRAHLEAQREEARTDRTLPEADSLGALWDGYRGGPEAEAPDVETAVDRRRLVGLLGAMTTPPEGFRPHPKIVRGIEARREMARGERPVDWATAEALALTSVAAEGLRVRLTGQDSERGTFSQRHAVLHDVEDGRTWEAFQGLAEGQAPVEVRNSPLSEAGVMGFEYGYSLDCPDGLLLWEAQFGDFVNAAQVIVDQFLASAEDKWRRLSGLVLLLPHGFEGQGPEHSSARLERFLALSADDNLQVAQPTTAANYFHLLRRQAVRRWRKPLVVLTPKSLLRHPDVASPLDELANGRFRRILPDDLAQGASCRRILLSSGKVAFDLRQRREELGREDVAILRVEQLQPLPDEVLAEALAPYADATPVVWVQEEPANMGAWTTLRARFGDRLLGRFPFSGVSRRASGSPATGSTASHRAEQERLVEQAFAGVEGSGG